MILNLQLATCNPYMKLPFVISLPHCSGLIPPEAREAVALSDEEIYESTDVGTREIFGLLPAKLVLSAPWSRIYVDLNRGVHQRGRRGVFARVDYYGRPIYREGFFPDQDEAEHRLRESYWPYHNRIKEAMERPDIQVLVDCHSLNGIGPQEAPDRGKRRKDIVLGNNGDQEGDRDPVLGTITCPAETLYLMGQAFQRAGFSVALNDPYSGGYIIKHHGQEAIKRGKMAFQIEINQDLYVEPSKRQLVPERLGDVRARVLRCMSTSLIDLLKGRPSAS